MSSAILIRLGGMLAIVGGLAATILGLLYVLQAWGMTLEFTAMALLKGHYENPVATILLIGVLAAIAALHFVQRRYYGRWGPPHLRCVLHRYCDGLWRQPYGRVGSYYGGCGHSLARLRCTSSDCRYRWPGDSDNQRWRVTSLVWNSYHRRQPPRRRYIVPVLHSIGDGRHLARGDRVGAGWDTLDCGWLCCLPGSNTSDSPTFASQMKE